MTGTGTIKGTVVKEIINYIRQEHGDAGFQQLAACLDADELKWVGAQLLPIAKVPSGVLCKIYDRIKKLWGHGESAYYSRIMEHVAGQNLSSFMKFFIRLGKPGFIVQGAPLVWKQFFDTGKLIYLGGASNFAEFKAEGGEEYGEALCAGIEGWGVAAIRLSGGKNIRSTHKECIHKGGRQCLYRVEWD